MKKVIVALALSAVAFGASAAQLITKEEVKHFKLDQSRADLGGAVRWRILFAFRSARSALQAGR